MRRRNLLITLYWVLVMALFGGAIYLVALRTPNEATMGKIQKIFYLHLPVAVNTLLGCLVVFVASAGYLWQRKNSWDHLATSAARVTIVLGSVVLLTGMVWGRGAWGRWWTWNPRLTFSLVLWLLYVTYFIVRNSIDSEQRRAVVAAVYGIIAFLDVPLVYLSTCMIPEIHPAPVELDAAMELALVAMFIPVTLAAIGLVLTGYLVARDQAVKAESAGNSVAGSRPADTSARLESLLRPNATLEISRE